MHFEAGAVLGRLKKKNVFPYLFDVRPEDVQGPLGAFQGTSNNEKDTRRLAEDLCKLAKAQVPARYDAHWKRLRARMEELKVERVSEVVADFRGLFQRKTFDEELKECTNQTWVDRYVGARETQKKLEGCKDIVGRACEPYQKELFNQLVSTIDGYAGLMKGLLIQERRFSFTGAGEVDFTRARDGHPHAGGEAVSPAVERRLKQIKRLVFLLDTPAAAAVTEEAVEFSRLSVHAERKEVVRAKQRAIEDGELNLTETQIVRCRESIWELDRIVFYLWEENSGKPRAQTLARCVEGELERLKAREDKASAMPLHYAIRALLAPGLVRDEPGLGALLDEVEQYLVTTERDGRNQIKSNLKKIRAAVAAQARPAQV